MQMLCKVAKSFSDVECPVCGQGFMVYWTRLGGKARREEREALVHGLGQQHDGDMTASAHPAVLHLPDSTTASVLTGRAAIPTSALLGVYS